MLSLRLDISTCPFFTVASKSLTFLAYSSAEKALLPTLLECPGGAMGTIKGALGAGGSGMAAAGGSGMATETCATLKASVRLGQADTAAED
jgi:hypothetical protein